MYKNDKFSIYQINIESAKSKLDSLQSIVSSLNVDLVTICETHLKKNDKFALEGYKCFSRNRQNTAKGGVATCVHEDFALNTLKVSEGADHDEYIVTRHGQFDPAVNVINLYGNQESRQSADQIKDSWDKILEEISKIEAKTKTWCF